MTAKEYARDCVPFDIPMRDTLIKVFTIALTDFATIKCKEQRELCGKEVNYPYRDEYGCVCDVPSIVLNAKQPEV